MHVANKEAETTVEHVIDVYSLGQQPYNHTLDAMHELTATRDGETCDQIWLVEHPPVFTQGQAGRAEHLLDVGDIPVIQSDRGGQVTYHGPGQLVAYVLIDIKRLGVGVRGLVTALEQSVIGALALRGIEGYARPDAPGVYVRTEAEGEMKISSLGLRVRRGCSFHGVAYNIMMDLSPFLRIDPCGYAGMRMTQLSNLIETPVSCSSEAPVWLDSFAAALTLQQGGEVRLMLVNQSGLPSVLSN